MPRLRFAPEFIQPILAETKRATTRRVRDKTEDTDIAPGTRCVAIRVDTGAPFANLRITHVETRRFDAIDDALARVENYRVADQLRASLRRFYPDITGSDRVRVLYFSREALSPGSEPAD